MRGTGLHVELEERVPGVRRDVAASQVMNGDAICQRVAPFAADALAMSRRQRAEEIVKRSVAFVVPMKLPVGALQEAVLGEKLPLVLGGECHVHR